MTRDVDQAARWEKIVLMLAGLAYRLAGWLAERAWLAERTVQRRRR